MSTGNDKKERRAAYMREYMRAYRAKHPERTKGTRVKYAIRLLKAEGYTITRDSVDV